MKKIYLLLSLLLVSLSYAQTPIITMIADGDETGGTPKLLEIYANGTVDFTQYSLENQTNANTTWGNAFDLSPLGTVTDAFVYVYNDTFQSASTGAFAANFPSLTSGVLDAGTSSVLSINGDDRVRIVNTSTTAVVDVYGVDGVDGTGAAWEYKDGYSKRADGSGPDPVFVEANWTYANGALDGHGAVQDGTTFESIIGLGTYVASTSNTPVLTITSPTPGQVFAPNVASVSVSFSVQNFNVANGTGDGYIVYTVDAGTPVDLFDTNPVSLTGLSRASHTVSMELVDNAGVALVPSVTSSVTFAVADYIIVSDMAVLRAQQLDGYYDFTGEAFAIAGEPYTSGNFKGFVQDATGGMMVFITAGVSTLITQVNDGDGITHIKGKLVDYHGVFELELTEDFDLTGNNVPQVPQVITAAELNANFDNYESELIEIDNTTIDAAGATLFEHSHNYNLTDATGVTVLRTTFSNMTDVAIPTVTVNVIGIGSEYSGTAQIFPRDDNDLVATGAVDHNNIDGFKVYPNPVTNGQVYVTSSSDDVKQVVVYNLLGKAVISAEVNNNQAIDVSSLRSGIYMMKVIENNQVSVRKLMIK